MKVGAEYEKPMSEFVPHQKCVVIFYCASCDKHFLHNEKQTEGLHGGAREVTEDELEAIRAILNR